MDDETDWQRNGMTKAEWDALSDDARKWRRDHPRQDPIDAHRFDSAQGLPAEPSAPGHAAEEAAPSGAAPAATPGLSPGGQGAQVILTGDAQRAARGGVHGTIEENTAARDAAITEGHVVTGTTAAAADEATGAVSEVEAEGRSLLHRAEDAAESVFDKTRAAFRKPPV